MDDPDFAHLEADDPAVVAVESVQKADPEALARTETLGRSLDLSPAVPPFRRIVEFFQQVPLKEVRGLPEAQKNLLMSRAAEILEIYKGLMSFDPATVANAGADRESYINQAKATYATTFEQLYPLVTYLSSRQRDLSVIQRETENALAAALAKVEQTTQALAQSKDEAARILDEVRRTAAESGVSQQASWFGQQATQEAGRVDEWQRRTNRFAVLLLSFAVLMLVLSFFIEPKSGYQALQFAIGKVLVFSTIAFLLFLSARTMMAYRHNEVVNRHRQNALLTFNALADAASSEQTREVVLTHASACIYAPQESGFTKAGNTPTAPSLIELAPRIIGSAQHAGPLA